METFFYTSLKTSTPLGTLRLAATDRGLVQLGFVKANGTFSDMPAAFTRDAGDHHEAVQKKAAPKNAVGRKSSTSENSRSQWIESPEKLKKYVSQLEAYIAGKRKEFDFRLDLRGTEFQKKCWNALLAIPFGETRNYADIARSVGSADAFRAVGQANHRNPVAIVVPCHRVITTAGTLGGYGGGLPTKIWLLNHEGHCMQQLREDQQPGDMKLVRDDRDKMDNRNKKYKRSSEPSAQLQLL